MNISTYGSRFFGGQISRIDDGLIELGHKVNQGGLSQLVYSNDMEHAQEAINHYSIHNNDCKLILNILDVPHWLPEWPKIALEWRPKLSLAHKVTCISKTVQNDIKQFLGIDAEVIYNPIKDVYPLNLETRKIFALFVGRALAPNKRVKDIIYPLYQFLCKNYQNGKYMIHFVGSENPGFGAFHGIVSDEELNRLYNDSAFTLISSKQEGLNLPMIEAICTGSIPIVCSDMSTASELCPPSFLCSSDNTGMIFKLFKDIEWLKDADNICEKYGELYREKFSPKSIASNIISVYNSLI